MVTGSDLLNWQFWPTERWEAVHWNFATPIRTCANSTALLPTEEIRLGPTRPLMLTPDPFPWGDTIVVGASGERSNATGVNGDQGDNSNPCAGSICLRARRNELEPASLS